MLPISIVAVQDATVSYVFSSMSMYDQQRQNQTSPLHSHHQIPVINVSLFDSPKDSEVSEHLSMYSRARVYVYDKQ